MQPVDEFEEEGNSFDRNDVMSEEEAFADDRIDIFDDGNSVENDDEVSQRGKKRKKGMKVGPKVAIRSSGKAKSKVWDHFKKVPVPSKTEPGVEGAIVDAETPRAVGLAHQEHRCGKRRGRNPDDALGEHDRHLALELVLLQLG